MYFIASSCPGSSRIGRTKGDEIDSPSSGRRGGRLLERRDLDLAHLEHRGHDALRRLGLGAGEQRGEPGGGDLPGDAEAILEPAARAVLAALAEAGPVLVDLGLVAAVDLERDRLAEPVPGAA